MRTNSVAGKNASVTPGGTDYRQTVGGNGSGQNLFTVSIDQIELNSGSSSVEGTNRVPMRLARKMANSARTVNQNHRNTLINNRPKGARPFGLLMED